MRVLVAEDDQVLAEAVADGLRRSGYAVDVAYDGESALDKGFAHPYDVIVVDRNLPVVHGDEVCWTLACAEVVRGRIMMLTAMGGADAVVDGLRLGADDYLAKPFHFKEFAARVDTLSRRTSPTAAPILERSGVRLDPVRRRVWRGSSPVALSKKEFGVLHELVRSGDRPVSGDALRSKVWDEKLDPRTPVVRVVVHRIRRKLGPPELIETVPGVGYRIR
ncbi:response regulator [Salininema proteolyticum]|uniref:Response regulator n=1 Tax=Salininema proteolyticum TaxID=1607685 RepID=A0ABV8U240_9ACTN